MNTVDILMATYNGGKYIEQQIDSIIAQSYADWRLFVRDDGSKDNTVDIVRQYTLTDKRIELVEDDLGNLGVTGNFAALIEYSKSQYTMFADQDDVWFEDKIAISINAIKQLEAEKPNAPILIFANSIITNSDLSFKYGTLYSKCHKYQLKDFLFANAGCQGAAMIFNKSLQEVLLPFPTNIRVHDYYISLVAYLNGYVGYIAKPLTYYRRHNTSVNPNNKPIGRRIKSFMSGEPILFYQDMYSCLKNYIATHQLSEKDQTLFNAYFYIVDVNNNLLKRIFKVIRCNFTLRSSVMYLILKLMFIRK